MLFSLLFDIFPNFLPFLTLVSSSEFFFTFMFKILFQIFSSFILKMCPYHLILPFVNLPSKLFISEPIFYFLFLLLLFFCFCTS
jgi:hypothetical protein